jgi:hypothetical protein
MPTGGGLGTEPLFGVRAAVRAARRTKPTVSREPGSTSLPDGPAQGPCAEQPRARLRTSAGPPRGTLAMSCAEPAEQGLRRQSSLRL